MADEWGERQPGDATRVRLDEAWEVAYWTKRFGVSAMRLTEVTNVAGPMVVNIERYLKSSAKAPHARLSDGPGDRARADPERGP